MHKKHLCELKECTGCYACANRCPKGAIELKISKVKAITPHIDENKCVNCGLCDKVCPVINKVELNIPKIVYAAYAVSSIRTSSASGGIATIIARKFINEGGVVYGAAVTNGITVEHIRVDSLDDISKLQGTKYVHSHMGNALSRIVDDIDSGKKVLLVGTPCQIAAARNFVPNKEGLYLIDLVCHGVPTWDTLMSCMRNEAQCNTFDDKTISFRDTDGFNIKIKDKSGNVLYQGDLKNSYYYNGFMEGYIYRDNCYTCRYAQKNRAGDITLGDFWGLDINNNFDGDIKNGINAVLINSDKGSELFNMIQDDVHKWQRNLEEAIKGNGQLRHPSKDSIHHKLFSVFIQLMNADRALVLCNIKKSTILHLRKLIRNSFLYNLLLRFFPKIEKRL